MLPTLQGTYHSTTHSQKIRAAALVPTASVSLLFDPVRLERASVSMLLSMALTVLFCSVPILQTHL